MSQDPLSLLCIEPRFPGRLGAVADWLVRKRGYRCRFYCAAADGREHWPEATGNGLDVIRFDVGGVAREAAAPWTRCLERGLCYAYGCWEVLDARPPRPIDLILGRSAELGSTLFAPVSLPGVPVVNLFDYYYHARAHDLAGEADEGPWPAAYYSWRRAANAMTLLDLENGVTPWTPTRWQRDLFPPEYRNDFVVLPDGVDPARFRRQDGRTRAVAGSPLPPGTKVVSFVARHLDRLRGFERFVLLANALLASYPDVLCLVVGDAPVRRGLDVRYFGTDYRAHVLSRAPLVDPGRVWFLGPVGPATVAEVLTASDLHVYPSRPYVVAQSLLEAMAAGCVVLAWDSEPVREFLTHGRNGLLVAPADAEDAVRQARAVLEDPAAHRPLGESAAALVRERRARDVTLPALADLFGRVVSGGRG